MAGGARAGLIAAALAPLPLAAAIAWSSEAGAARSLPRAVVTVEAGNLHVGARRVTRLGRDSEPDWSPDRRRIAFVRQDPTGRTSSIYVIRRDGGGLIRLTGGGKVVAMPAWSGDGRRIAYAASPVEGGSFDIWVVPSEGGEPRLLAGGRAEQVAPSFTRAGRVRFRKLQPGEPFPEKTSDRETARTGPLELLPDFDQRSPFRLVMVGTKLGFASATDNVGAGPVWIRGSRSAPGTPMAVRQLVRLTDGSVRAYDAVGRLRYTPSPTHTHWHVLDFQRYELRSLDGDLLLRDRKSGFCLADHYGQAARRVQGFSGPRFLGNCAQGDPDALAVEQGTSPGYTDLYPPHFHGQNLELKGVAAGDYVLVHRANSDGLLEELDYTNNAASIRIRVSWVDGVPKVRTLRTCQASASC